MNFVIEGIKDIGNIISDIFNFAKQFILFIPQPFVSYLLIYFGIFVAIMFYKKVRGES